MTRPTVACPDHPTAAVLAARSPGAKNKQWVCLKCGKKLGDAGPVIYEDWEVQTINIDERDEDDS